MKDNIVQIRQIGQELACVECGAVTHSACECGAAYMPAGAKATKAIAENPGKSDRAIAAAIGVSDKTVAAAREKSGAEHSARDTQFGRRVGRDGKHYPATREPPPSDSDHENAPVLAFQVRAGEALRYCFYEGPPSKQAAKAARQTAQAWQKLADEIEEML